jgi:CDP-diacylglycerol--glycerol-3-phosphate 3-phosphatidyltransferase
MTTANKITIFRILLTPFFATQLIYYGETGRDGFRWLALLSFLLAAILDGVDGYIARRYNQKSELGAILDPLADKLLLVSAIVLLTLGRGTYFTPIPLWMTATIAGRDSILLLGALLIYMTAGKVAVRPRVSGKVATVLQMGMVLWTLFKWDSRALPFWVWSVVVFTGYSGVRYMMDGIGQLSASPASSARP